MHKLLVAAAMVMATALGACESLEGPPPLSADQIAANDDAACLSYGLKHGTGDYAQCRLKLQEMRGQRSQAIMNAYLSRPQPAPAQIYAPPPIQPPRSCNSFVNGNMISTNCY